MKYFSPSILDGSVTTATLADGAVTEAKMAMGSVGNAQLVGGAVTGNKLAANVITQVKISTSETSLSGSIPSNGSIDLVLAPYTFWPMLHVEDREKVRVTGHSVDSAGADNARLGLDNNTAGAENYDLDYRNVA